MRRLCIAGLVVAALAGCGGDDGDGGGDTLTKAEAIAQGDAICRDFRATTDKLDEEIQDIESPSIKELAPYFRRGTDAANDALKKFRDLEVPEDDKAIFDGYIAGQAEAIGDLEEVTDAAQAGDEAEVQRLIDDADEDRQDALAKRYGFKICGSEDN